MRHQPLVIVLCMTWMGCISCLGCTTLSLTNVSSGVSSGRKFVVSSTDCCNVCSAQSDCVGSTYVNFYCTFFTSIHATAHAPGVTLLLSATPAPTPAPTSPPPLPPPSAYALLTTSSYSSTCTLTSTFEYETVALPLSRCQQQQQQQQTSSVSSNKISTSSQLAVESAGGLWLYEFDGASCQGRKQSSTWFPLNCTFNEQDEVYRVGQAIRWQNKTGKFQVMYAVCEALCEEDCNAVWTATSGMCNAGEAGSSSSGGSSSSASSSNAAQGGSWMALYDDGWALVFQYSSSDCSGVSASALAYPCGSCFSNNIAIPRKVSCTPLGV